MNTNSTSTDKPTTNDNNPANLLNDVDAAKHIGVSTASLRKARGGEPLRGVEGPEFLKIGRQVRYHIDALDAWRERAVLRCKSTADHTAQLAARSTA